MMPIATTVAAQEPGDTVVPEKGNPGVIAIPEEGGRYRKETLTCCCPSHTPGPRNLTDNRKTAEK